MANTRIVHFECKECGSEVVITATGEVQLSPIYCCGVEVIEIPSGVNKQTKPKKQIAKKTTKKVTQEKVPQKKKPLSKKK